MMTTEPHAPELRISQWIGLHGETLDTPVTLANLGDGVKILFAFQDWCTGCHSHGFPTLQRLYSALEPRGVGFAAIQTVFEGPEANTFDKLRVNQTRYRLPIPFGHDEPPEGSSLPTFMQDYHTHGTPWFTVIDAEGKLVYSGFHLDAERLATALLQE
ncbi:peroxiredoxin [uncultured Brevundimonas sp.]|uniref:peroxiredoxin family protein n=1 Tax=uncultured Brevundimonas sp. TaxID=213418 RepID=UPI002600C426|nr:redoxin domain-containing protein [uncultured Brevundimonas sp.]